MITLFFQEYIWGISFLILVSDQIIGLHSMVIIFIGMNKKILFTIILLLGACSPDHKEQKATPMGKTEEEVKPPIKCQWDKNYVASLHCETLPPETQAYVLISKNKDGIEQYWGVTVYLDSLKKGDVCTLYRIVQTQRVDHDFVKKGGEKIDQPEEREGAEEIEEIKRIAEIEIAKQEGGEEYLFDTNAENYNPYVYYICKEDFKAIQPSLTDISSFIQPYIVQKVGPMDIKGPINIENQFAHHIAFPKTLGNAFNISLLSSDNGATQYEYLRYSYLGTIHFKLKTQEK